MIDRPARGSTVGDAAPLIQNPRARFYFTEKGWNKVGRFVTSEAQKKGFVMKVIRRKNSAASQIVYRDGLQVALLPGNWRRKNAKAAISRVWSGPLPLRLEGIQPGG